MAKDYNMFQKIILANTGYSESKKLCIIDCTQDKGDIDYEYCKLINEIDIAYEIIGMKDQQIKPVGDCDPKFNKNDQIDVLETIKDGVQKMDKMYPDKEKFAIQRIRIIGENTKKISYHITVDGVRTNIQTIKNKLQKFGYGKDKPFDESIYSLNRGLYGCFTNKKKNSDGGFDYVEMFKPICLKTGKIFQKIDQIDIRKYCPSYVEESFECDFMEPPKGPIEPKEIEKQYDDEDKDNSKLNLEEIIKHLKPFRAENRDDWLNGIFSVMNCAENLGMSKKKQKDIAHLFSSICESKYEEDQVDDWLSLNFDKKREYGYRWKFLLDWLKEDDIDYYNSIINVKKKNELLPYKDKKQEFEKNHFKLLYPAYVITIEEDEIICSKMTDASNTYEHLQCTKISNDGEIVIKQFFPLWRKDSDIKTHRKMGWKPPPLKMEHLDDFNLFEDFKIKKIALIKTERNYFQEYYDFGFNLFGDAKINNYIFSMMAYKIQNPAFRTEILTILSGGEGDGKSTFVRTFFNLFDDYTMELQNLNLFFEDKNTLEYRKLLICIDDVSGTGNFEHDGQLRSRITGNKLTVRPLYEQSKTIDNHCDYWMTTNNKNVVKMCDDADRRFFQTETTQYYLGNTDFWDDFKENIQNNPIALRHIYEGLMKFDYKKYITKGFQSKDDKPITDIMKLNQKANRDKIIYFYQDLMIDHFNTREKKEKDDWKDYDSEDENDKSLKTNIKKFDNKMLFKRWDSFCKQSNIKLEFTNIQFGIKTTSLGKKIETSTNKKGIEKDTKKNTTTIYFEVIKEYFDLID